MSPNALISIDRRLARGSQAIADAGHVDHRRHIVDANDVSAEEDAGRHRRRRAPLALVGGTFTERGLEKRFARRAAEHRSIERGDLVEPGEHLEAVVGSLREAQPGIDNDGLAPHAGPIRPGDRLRELCRHLR